MPQLPKRLLATALALIALTVFPPLAKAQPQRKAVRAAAGRTAASPSLFADIRSFLFILWAENGSGLEPDGANTTSGTTGDNGSGLDPDGRR